MRYIFPPIMVVLVFSTLCQAEQYKSRQSSQGTSVAVVLGQEITIGDLEPHTKMIELNRARMNNSRFDDWLEGFRKNRLNGLIFGLLLQKYARDNKIEPTNEDIEIFRQKTSAQEEENRR